MRLLLQLLTFTTLLAGLTAPLSAQDTLKIKTLDSEGKLSQALTQAPWVILSNAKTIANLKFQADGTAVYRIIPGKEKFPWAWKATSAFEFELINHTGKSAIMKIDPRLKEFSGLDHHGTLITGRATQQ